MELYHVIREIGLLTSSDAKFYCASFLHILSLMHRELIIYRDIKPENTIVKSSNGYLKIVDLGVAK